MRFFLIPTIKQSLCLIILLLFIQQFSFSQETEIQEIRDRFYALSNEGISLRKQLIDDLEFYFKDNNLKKVVSKSENRIAEFYFDLNYIKDHAYFIYTIDSHGDQRLENRFYFQKGGEMIRWLNPDKKKVSKGDKSYCPTGKEMIAQSKDMLIKLKNEPANQKYPGHARLMKLIDSIVVAIEKLELVGDTIEIQSLHDDQGSTYATTIKYKSVSGQLLKTLTFSQDDHRDYSTNTYFDQLNNKICETRRSSYIFGGGSEIRKYYDDNQLIRTSSSVIESSPPGPECFSYHHTFVGVVEDY